MEDRERQGEGALSDLVASLKGLEGLCTGDQFKELCFFLTLARLCDHPDYRVWSVAQGRYDTLSDVLQGLNPLYGTVKQKDVPEQLEVLLSHALQNKSLRLNGESLPSGQSTACLGQAPIEKSIRTAAQTVHASLDLKRLQLLPSGNMKGSEPLVAVQESIPKQESESSLNPHALEPILQANTRRDDSNFAAGEGAASREIYVREPQTNVSCDAAKISSTRKEIVEGDTNLAKVDPNSHQKHRFQKEGVVADVTRAVVHDNWHPHEASNAVMPDDWQSEGISNSGLHQEWQSEESVYAGDNAHWGEPTPPPQNGTDQEEDVDMDGMDQRRPVAWTIQFDSPTKPSPASPSPEKPPPSLAPPPPRRGEASRASDETSALSRAAPPLASRRPADRREGRAGASGDVGGSGGASLNGATAGRAARGGHENETAAIRPLSRTGKRDGAGKADDRAALRAKGDEGFQKRVGGPAEWDCRGEAERAVSRDGRGQGPRKSGLKEAPRSDDGDAGGSRAGQEGDRRSVSTLGPLGVTMTQQYSPPASPRHETDAGAGGAGAGPAWRALERGEQTWGSGREEAVDGGHRGVSEWYGRGLRSEYGGGGEARLSEKMAAAVEAGKAETDGAVRRGAVQAWGDDGGQGKDGLMGRPSTVPQRTGEDAGDVGEAGIGGAVLDATGVWAPGVLRTALEDAGVAGGSEGVGRGIPRSLPQEVQARSGAGGKASEVDGNGPGSRSVHGAEGEGGHEGIGRRGGAEWGRSAGAAAQRRDLDVAAGREGAGVGGRGGPLGAAGLEAGHSNGEAAGMERGVRTAGNQRRNDEGSADPGLRDLGGQGWSKEAGYGPAGGAGRWTGEEGTGIKGWTHAGGNAGRGGVRDDGGAGGKDWRHEGRSVALGHGGGGLDIGAGQRGGRELDGGGAAVRGRGAEAWMEGHHGWEGLVQRASLEEEDVVRVVAWRPAEGEGFARAGPGVEGATLAVGTTGGSVRVARVVGDVGRGARGKAGLEGVYCMGSLHKGSVYALVWSRDGSAMASASNDKTICVVRQLFETLRLRTLDGVLAEHEAPCRLTVACI